MRITKNSIMLASLIVTANLSLAEVVLLDTFDSANSLYINTNLAVRQTGSAAPVDWTDNVPGGNYWFTQIESQFMRLYINNVAFASFAQPDMDFSAYGNSATISVDLQNLDPADGFSMVNFGMAASDGFDGNAGYSFRLDARSGITHLDFFESGAFAGRMDVTSLLSGGLDSLVIDFSGGNTVSAAFNGTAYDFGFGQSSYTGVSEPENRVMLGWFGDGDPPLTSVRFDNLKIEAAGTISYDGWTASYDLVASNNTYSADPDGDGASNMHEWSLGGDPTNPVVQGMEPVYDIELSGGTNWVVCTYPSNPLASSLTYHIETTEDLVSGVWTNEGYVVGVGPNAGNPEFMSVSNQVSMKGFDQRFIQLAIQEKEPASDSGPLVGAIRWDAWYGDGTGVNGAVEATLSVQQWQSRSPFFTDVDSSSQVRIRGEAENIRQEIDFAADAGLDYWAFVIYPPEENLSRALDLYLAAPNRGKVNFCINLQGGWFGKEGLSAALARIPRYVGYMQRPEYQTVLGGRPLIYLLYPQSLVGNDALNNDNEAIQLIAALRIQAQAAGLETPYIVFQDYNASNVDAFRQLYGADAIGAYAANTNPLNATYQDLQDYVEGPFWASFLNTGSEFVPLASTGFDLRPRIETPPPWDPNLGNLNPDTGYDQPTPTEFVDHLTNSLQYLEDHSQFTPANTVLIYAWNEFDEGGWLCPTLGGGSARIDALHALELE